MDRYASKTLRTLGIVLTSIILVIGGLILLLFTLCAFSGQSTQPSNNAGLIWSLVLSLFLAVGIFIIATLARGLAHPSGLPQPPLINLNATGAAPTSTPPDAVTAPEIDPAAASQSIRNLAFAIAAQLFLSALNSTLASTHRPAIFQPVPKVFGSHSFLLVSFVLAHLPYLLVLVSLFRKPGPRTFSFALAIPFVLALPSLLLASGASGVGGLAILSAMAAGVLNFLILYLAWRAIRTTGIHPSPGSILIAALITFSYSCSIPFILLYVAHTTGLLVGVTLGKVPHPPLQPTSQLLRSQSC
jgi:hypothetical protein